MEHPFLAHLIPILSIYEHGHPRAPIPPYDGPSTWQTDYILRALKTITDRMYTAEHSLAYNLDLKNHQGLGDIPHPSNPSAESSQGSLSSAVTTSLKSFSPSGTPLVVPPGLLGVTTFETEKDAVDELRLVKAQVSDVVRVCDAVARGDLSHKITVPVQGAFMVQLKDVINRMVDKLDQFAKEVDRVSHVFGTEYIFGGHACMEGFQGTWADLAANLNKMAGNITDQMRSISEVTKAVAMGDLSKRVQFDAQGEMLDVQMTVNSMVNQLSTLADEVTRLSLQVGAEGILGGQATVPDVKGIWKVLTDNVNLMAMNMTNQVRSMTEVAKAVTSGDLTNAIQVDVRGELLDLNKAVNGMTENLNDFATQVTRVVREVGTEGLLDRRTNLPNVSGSWKELTDCVNAMAANFTLQVRTFAVATTAVARGDLTQKVVGLSVSGEYLHLANTMNRMIDELGFFALEVKKVADEVGTQGNLGVQADVGNAQGIWQEITMSVNTMASNLTDQVRAFAQISSTPIDSDFVRSITAEAGSELDPLKTQVNRMVFNLRDNITSAVARGTTELVNRRKSELLGYVAHEIKAPMNGIIGTTEISLESELDRSQRENWLLVQSLARCLLLIIDDLSDISKLETGRMVMAQVSFSFRQTVFGILKTLVVRAAGNNVDLTYDVDPDIPDQLIGDFLRLQQVITTLVNNAIKFTSPGGHVSLSCRRLGVYHSTVTTEICVSDNGVGITKDKLNLISDAFAQADCSTITDYEVVGLGLSISKFLVSLMGGSMWVESVAGEGSKFFFTITSQIGQLSIDSALAKTMPFRNRSVLFVDTQNDRTGAVDRFQELGLRPYVIHDTLEVADKATCPLIDISFIDSLSATKTIREYEHLRQIPIVLLAPDLPHLNLKWCFDNGIYSGVTTPLTAQDLASVLIPAFESITVSPVAPTNGVKFDILFAEDNLVSQKVVVKILQKYGHAVEIVENGSLAVGAFEARARQNRPFDTILMNYSLPIMGGIEATELIRAYETHNNLIPTPIIAVTVHTMIGDRERCLNAGMDDLITKPLRRGDLLNLIAKFAGERGRQRGHVAL